MHTSAWYQNGSSLESSLPETKASNLIFCKCILISFAIILIIFMEDEMIKAMTIIYDLSSSVPVMMEIMFFCGFHDAAALCIFFLMWGFFFFFFFFKPKCAEHHQMQVKVCTNMWKLVEYFLHGFIPEHFCCFNSKFFPGHYLLSACKLEKKEQYIFLTATKSYDNAYKPWHMRWHFVTHLPMKESCWIFFFCLISQWYHFVVE